MSKANRMGLGSVLGKEVELLNSMVMGRSSIGRISDLSVVWATRRKLVPEEQFGKLRVLIQALLEYSQPNDKAPSGYYEFSVHEGRAYVSVRFPNTHEVGEGLEQALMEYWKSSEEIQWVKNVLIPTDEVVVLVHPKTNQIEWRVSRRVQGVQEASAEGPSFTVLSDTSEKIETEHENYVEIGDLPFDDWMSDVYRSSKEKKQSFEQITIKGASEEKETEHTRTISGDFDASRSDEETLVKGVSKDEEATFIKNAGSYLEKVSTQIISGSAEDQEQAKQSIQETKKRELMISREVQLLRDRLKNAEDLGKDRSSEHRKKADQLFEELQKAKADAKSLRKLLDEQKTIGSVAESSETEGSLSVGTSENAVSNALQVEELTKKLERTVRALETEKEKVKVLSDRATKAEKEAQTTKPMLQGLEKKLEHAAKVAEQQKKDIDAVKQKVVKAEAEKNKIKNELMKAEAQIKTLTKRLAS